MRFFGVSDPVSGITHQNQFIPPRKLQIGFSPPRASPSSISNSTRNSSFNPSGIINKASENIQWPGTFTTKGSFRSIALQDQIVPPISRFSLPQLGSKLILTMIHLCLLNIYDVGAYLSHRLEFPSYAR